MSLHEEVKGTLKELAERFLHHGDVAGADRMTPEQRVLYASGCTIVALHNFIHTRRTKGKAEANRKLIAEFERAAAILPGESD